MNKVLIKKIFAAVMAAAVMTSFTAVSVYAEPDMVIGEEDVEYSEEDIVVEEENEDAEEENPEEEIEDEEEENPVEEEDPEAENPEDVIDPDEPTDDDLLDTTLPEPTYTPSGDLTMYASTTINVRQGPGTDYDKLGVLYAGDQVTVVGYNGEWMAFSYSGATGYVLGSLLSETPPAPETTTTTQAPQTAPPETEPPVETETEAPVETDVVIESEAPEASEPEEEEVPTTKPVEDKPEEEEKEDDDEEAGAAPVEDNKNGSGLQGILIAALCALGTFILVGVLPVVIHRIHHKKLYQY